MKAAVLFLVFLIKTGFGQMLWEFGNDAPKSVVFEAIRGSQGFFEYNKNIPLLVPPCHRVSYVRVEVFNQLSTPYVSYNKHVSVVTISYKFTQNTISSYTITVRGVVDPNCKN